MSIVKCGIKLLIHSETVTIAPFGEWIISWFRGTGVLGFWYTETIDAAVILDKIFSKLKSRTDILNISCGIAIGWMPQYLTDEYSKLVQLMAWLLGDKRSSSVFCHIIYSFNSEVIYLNNAGLHTLTQAVAMNTLILSLFFNFTGSKFQTLEPKYLKELYPNL